MTKERIVSNRAPLSLAFLAAVTLASLVFTSPASAAEPLARLALEPYRKGVAARIEVGGKQRLFQFDTAGGVTVISPELAAELGCKPWSVLTGYHMTGTKISSPRCDNIRMIWGGQRLTAPVVAVTTVGSAESPIDGLLALDVFAGKTITIDFARGELVVETPQSAADRTRNAVELPAHIAREIGGLALSVFVEVPTARGPLRMELDSGNGGTLLVSRPLLQSLGLQGDGDKPIRGTIQLAPGVAASGLIFAPDLLIDGNLGMPFLKDWVVTIDLQSSRVWLQPTKVAPPPGMGEPPVIADR